MASLAEIRAEFSSRALEPETRFVLRAEDALALIDRAVEAGATLAGVEGFRIVDGWVASALQEYSTDSADVGLAQSEFVELSKHTIRAGALTEVRFEVVFEGEYVRTRLA